MQTLRFRSLLLVVLACILAQSSHAHLSYFGRDFGTFTGLTLQSKTITGQTVETNYGWADGADADWASAHYQTYFKFTLQRTSVITLSVTSTDVIHFLPAYSIYSGLGKTSPPDYDESGITIDYLISLGSPGREGGFDALHTWKMGNDDTQTFADMSVFTYVGHAADGTSANFGPMEGIWGDGNADGVISRSFTLAAGTYTVAIGGASYFNQIDANFHGFSATLSVAAVPEPSMVGLLFAGLPICGFLRFRPSPGRSPRY